MIDSSKPIRDGEELDDQKLVDYLARALPEFDGDLVIEQFPGGHSNLTYLLIQGEKEYVLRRPPFGRKIKSAHDMGREYRILSSLAPVFPLAPKPLLYCEDEAVLGASFYVMERLRGIVLRARPPKELTLSPEVMGKLSRNFIDTLVRLHAVDYEAIGLGTLGKPKGYIERQINGWIRRYQDAQTEKIEAIDAIAKWLINEMPEDGRASLIHNDYKYDNLVLSPENPSEIIGILDWEMTTIGDPLMDLGTVLSYWVEPTDPPELVKNAFGPTMLPGNLSRAELAARYEARTEQSLPDMLFYYIFALFKLAVIAQQIYGRYEAGHSKDERFSKFIDLVKLMGFAATERLEKGTISD